MKKYLFFFLLALGQVSQAQQILTADQVLKEAYALAAKENKNVFVLFHASWCVWCHKMDDSMKDPSCKDFFDRSYVVRHLVVNESPQNKKLENPGAAALLSRHGGEGQGIPFWLVFDSEGKLLADSQRVPGENVGCPASREEVDHFIQVLKKTSSISSEEETSVRKRFRENEQ